MDRKKMAAEGHGLFPADGYVLVEKHNHEEGCGFEKLCGEDFLVDDLLDLGGIASVLEDDLEEEEHDDISTSSAVSNQPPVVEEGPIVPVGVDVADLEWVSHFVDDSFPLVAPVVSPERKTHLRFVPNSVTSRTSSLVSALLGPNFARLRCRARTKRSRRVWSMSRPDLTDPLCSSSSACSSSSSSSSSCLVYEPYSMSTELLPLPPEFSEPHSIATELLALPSPEFFQLPRGRGRPPLHKLNKPGDRKTKIKKPKPEPEPEDGGGGGGRKCSHCGVQKTPQWRTGPMGAKTLCNACGVRYKSGRLLPEYRPACSPTFISHVHSNSHRKVLEMRRQKELLRHPDDAAAVLPPVVF